MENNLATIKGVERTELTQCYGCRKQFPHNELTEKGGEFFCTSCVEDYALCYHCNTLINIEESRLFNHQYWCDDCFREEHFKCAFCGIWCRNSRLYTEYESETVCNRCAADSLRPCYDCGYVGHIDDMYWNEHDEEWYCQSCIPREDEMRDHGYRPELNYLNARESDRPLFYGIELEVEVPRETARDILVEEMMDKFGREWFYVKADGSLNHGMEIVTHPMTYEYITKEIEKFSKILKFLENQECKSFNTDTCGIHIHISKDQISHLTTYKILKLFYENPGFILKISQRRVQKFEEWSKLHRKEEETAETNLYTKAKYKSGIARYVAVNLNNSDTIEFRIFRGTLHCPSFLKNVEFIRSVVEFCEKHSIPEITTLRYLDYLKENKKEHKNLTDFLTRKNLWRRENHVYRNSADQE